MKWIVFAIHSLTRERDTREIPLLLSEPRGLVFQFPEYDREIVIRECSGGKIRRSLLNEKKFILFIFKIDDFKNVK
jgi:hypothetical protein